MSFQELLERAAALPESERAALAALLIESLDPGRDDDADAAWAAEVERRLAELDRGESGVAWESVRQGLLRRTE
jgi:putative addiction module component (TIGR02574 family)